MLQNRAWPGRAPATERGAAFRRCSSTADLFANSTPRHEIRCVMRATVRLSTLAALVAVALLSLPFAGSHAQGTAAGSDASKTSFLLTIFLRHDQSKTLEQINQQLQANGYFKKFPPEGIEVVSWYVMMGIGQVVTLRVPPERLREVNRAIEESAWGGFRTEFYPTYDFKAIAAQQRN
jgi:hypothetical protein